MAPRISAISLLTPALRRLFFMLCAALMGYGFAHIGNVQHIYASPGYLYGVTALLAIGIYGSTSGIPLTQLRQHKRTIILAITVGVLLKATLVSLVMYAVLGQPIYAMLLGVAVAQIDPLAVIAIITTSRMSDSAKTILLAWSSFDDPVTMILTIYLLTFAASASPHNTSPGSLVLSLIENLVFATIVFGVIKLIKWITSNSAIYITLERKPVFNQFKQVTNIVLLLIIGVVTVLNSYFLGLAIIGLFFRPNISSILDHLIQAVLLIATCALGLLLTNGIHLIPGIALGVAGYIAQVIATPLVAGKTCRVDKIYLALGQQNGITAVILALLMESKFPDAVGTIAPAIFVVNIIYALANLCWERMDRAIT